MKILLAFVHMGILGFLAFRMWRRESSLKLFLWPAFLVRIMAGVALGLLYTYYYSIGDTFSFFDDGVKLAALAREDFMRYLKFLWAGDETFSLWAQLVYQQPRAVFMTKIISVFNLLTFDIYWLTALYFSAISFGCSWYLVKALVRFFPEAQTGSLIAFLFFPSVVFWSSGVIKESLAAASLFFLTAVFLKVWFRERVRVAEVLGSGLAVWIVWNLKYYFAAVFIPVVITSLLLRYVILPVLRPKQKRMEFALWIACFALLLFIASAVHPNFYPDRFLGVVVDNHDAFLKISSPDDVIHFYQLRPDVLSMLINAPWALISGLFRPFIWESGNVLQFFIAVENLVLLALFMSSLSRWKLILQTPHRLLILSMIVYVVFLCIFLTLSTPNFGTLSRYRIGYLPYVLWLMMLHNPFLSGFGNFMERSFRNLVR